MTGFLRDITGNRRFWPVTVAGGCDKHPWNLTKEYIEQVWAEAVHLYIQGEDLLLEGDAEETAREMQIESMETDDREGLVREYLDKLLPDDWATMSLSDRRMFLAGDDFMSQSKVGTVKRDRVCNLELWAECFGKDPTAIKKQDSYELTAIMTKMEGWKRYEGNKTGKLRCPPYGTQLVYVRDEEEA
jgi:hypothetical protein